MVEAVILKAVETALAESKERERKFKQTVDLAFNLKNVDLSVPKNRIDEEVPLPHGRGKAVKIGVFASGDLAARVRPIADVVITPDQIGDLASDKKKFKKLVRDVHYFLAEAPLMPTIGKSLGAVLGPRNKMPRPIPPTMDPRGLLENLRRTVKVRSKDRRTFHATVGTDDMNANQLAENAELVLKRVEAKLEQGRNNLQSVYIKTTMGPASKVI